MKHFETYKKWLIIDSIIIMLIGIYVAFFKETKLFIFDNFLDQYFWSGNDMPLNGSINYLSFIYSIMGAVMLLWGILMYYIVKIPFGKKELWSWKALTICIIVWFAIDEFFSLHYGAVFNAAFNIPFLIIIITPLLLSKKAFNEKEEN